MRNKKGQGMSTEMMIGLIILLIVAVFAIWSFTQSGKDFWAKITGSRGGSTLDAAVSGCNQDVGTQAYDDFCSNLRDVNLNGSEQYVTCSYIADRLSSVLTCNPDVQGASLIANCKALNKLKIKVNGVDINAPANCNDVGLTGPVTPVTPKACGSNTDCTAPQTCKITAPAKIGTCQ